eukprot:CAMPEP_0183703718 /NCGR_PEP_ID=MMETSP0737-20130205/1358_1 /TAXON_ID=385413 /ORGANISM="Thalassiosira miniscula, Strain CCMP1093" /LENGTH=859 /DNA_ID=CAMNT_0025930515 /DNA_START=80 /DNA_END=2659 /DNA_ORIENTATION=-
MKEGGNITILLLGDARVGKSSLASTFVSRHFSEQVPGIVTRVRLPPDQSLSKCTTTIIDTQEGDAALSNALSLIGNVKDSAASIHTSNTNTAGSFSSDGKSDGGGQGVVDADLSDANDVVSAEGTVQKRRGSSVTSLSPQHQSGSANFAATSPFRKVDSIVLVYDLDRAETFHRLEHHWLPLVEQCYNGDLPVIVAGNKMDLASDPDHSPTRQQIISLLQQFKFVRQCIKCSVKKLLNVDEVFLKSQQSVVYPIAPLYDLHTGRLSAACRRAFTRIFRMFDDDRDGLLSDVELNSFQEKIWGVSLTEKDFAGWKKLATQHESSRDGESEAVELICNGKFTVAGFLAIFDVLITDQNRLEVPWKVLRTLGYDDDLNLNIPAPISPRVRDAIEFGYLHPDDWRLTSSDIEFLTNIFLQFDSEGNGILSSKDIHSIFSVLPIPHPPWDECRASLLFQECFSLPCVGDDDITPSSPGDLSFDPIGGSPPSSQPSSPSSIISASGVTISSSPLPSVEISKDSGSLCFTDFSRHKPLSFISWINRWHMICAISPTIARAEMYRVGCNFFDRKTPILLDNPSRDSRVTYRVPPVINMPTIFVRALILGGKDSGKRVFAQKLHRLSFSHCRDYEKEGSTTSCSATKVFRPTSRDTKKGVETIVHFISTEIPEIDTSIYSDKINLKNQLGILLGQEKFGKRPYDMAVLVFDATNKKSLEFAKDLESTVLTEDMPRMYVCTNTAETTKSVLEMKSNEQIQEAHDHCKHMDLEPPLLVPLNDEVKLDSSILVHLVSCSQGEHQDFVPFRSTPHGERKRNAAKRKKALWIGGLVTAGITVVLGLALTRKKKVVSERGGWFKFFQKMLRGQV